MIETFLEIEPSTLLFLILLITAFLFAFKVLSMIIQTVIVAFLSGIFYIGLVVIIGIELSIDRILLFSFLGATFYMLYSFLISAYSVTAKIIGIPYRLAYFIIFIPLKYLSSHIGDVRKEIKRKAEEEREKEQKIKSKVREKVRKDKD